MGTTEDLCSCTQPDMVAYALGFMGLGLRLSGEGHKAKKKRIVTQLIPVACSIF